MESEQSKQQPELAYSTPAMAMPAAHFSHPQHELKLRESFHLSHQCALCGEKLTGGGYSCHRRLCEFHLHEECARYPETLRAFFAHPWHDLTLSRTDDDDDDDGRSRRSSTSSCVLCREEAPDGVFVYRCAPCGFAVHPRCSSVPQAVRSVLHPDHALSLTAVLRADRAVTTCAACREPCGVWYYRCGPCDVDLHVDCLHGARPSTTTTATTGGGSSSKEKESSLGHKFVECLTEGAGEGLVEAAVDNFVNTFQN